MRLPCLHYKPFCNGHLGFSKGIRRFTPAIFLKTGSSCESQANPGVARVGVHETLDDFPELQMGRAIEWAPVHAGSFHDQKPHQHRIARYIRAAIIRRLVFQRWTVEL